MTDLFGALMLFVAQVIRPFIAAGHLVGGHADTSQRGQLEVNALTHSPQSGQTGGRYSRAIISDSQSRQIAMGAGPGQGSCPIIGISVDPHFAQPAVAVTLSIIFSLPSAHLE